MPVCTRKHKSGPSSTDQDSSWTYSLVVLLVEASSIWVYILISIYISHVQYKHTLTHHLLGICSKGCRFPGGFEEEGGGISKGTTLTLLGLDT